MYPFSTSGRVNGIGIQFTTHFSSLFSMALRQILVYPDKRLRQISEAVTEFNEDLETLVRDMADTMYDAPGIGLAAVQIDVAKRVVIMDLSEARDQLQVFINPEITDLIRGWSKWKKAACQCREYMQRSSGQGV